MGRVGHMEDVNLIESEMARRVCIAIQLHRNESFHSYFAVFPWLVGK